MEPIGFALICVAALVGAIGQRALGMGFGLVAMPALVLVLGPLAAVTAINALGIVTSALVLAQVWRDVEWRRLLWLLIPALLGVVPGILLARVADSDALKTIIGALILAGVALTLWMRGTERALAGDSPVAAAGGIAGLLNGSVGVGAPALGLYGALGDWDQRSYAATLQPFFVALSATTVAMKALFDPASTLSWSWWEWALVVVPVVLGVLVGHRIASRLPERAARAGILLISSLGGASVLGAGIAGLVGT